MRSTHSLDVQRKDGAKSEVDDTYQFNLPRKSVKHPKNLLYLTQFGLPNNWTFVKWGKNGVHNL